MQWWVLPVFSVSGVRNYVLYNYSVNQQSSGWGAWPTLACQGTAGSCLLQSWWIQSPLLVLLYFWWLLLPCSSPHGSLFSNCVPTSVATSAASYLSEATGALFVRPWLPWLLKQTHLSTKTNETTLFKAPELLKIFFLGSEVSLDCTDLTSDMSSIRAHVHQQFMQGMQILWSRPARMGHICVALAQAAVKTAPCETELQQAFPEVSPMYPLPMVHHLHAQIPFLNSSENWSLDWEWVFRCLYGSTVRSLSSPPVTGAFHSN